MIDPQPPPSSLPRKSKTKTHRSAIGSSSERRWCRGGRAVNPTFGLVVGFLVCTKKGFLIKSMPPILVETHNHPQFAFFFDNFLRAHHTSRPSRFTPATALFAPKIIIKFVTNCRKKSCKTVIFDRRNFPSAPPAAKPLLLLPERRKKAVCVKPTRVPPRTTSKEKVFSARKTRNLF